MLLKNKNVVAVIILAVCVSVVLGVKYYKDNREVSVMTGRAKGDPEAAIKIIEYIDFQCPACAAGALYLKKQIEQRPEQFYLEMNYFPLRFHAHAFLSSRFAECASQQNKFWEYHDKLIESQKEWHKLVNAFPVFERMAQEVNLDMNTLNVCLADGKIDKVINEHKETGKKLGVRSTPTYFVNGKLVVGLKELQKEITSLLGGTSN